MNARNKRAAIAAAIAGSLVLAFTYFRMPAPKIAGLTRPTLTLSKVEATPAPTPGRPAAGRPTPANQPGAAGDKGAAARPAYRAKTPEERREAAKKRREEMMARRRAAKGGEGGPDAVGSMAPNSRLGRVGPRSPVGRAAGPDAAMAPGGRMPPGGDVAPLEELDGQPPPPPEHFEGDGAPDEEAGGEIE